MKPSNADELVRNLNQRFSNDDGEHKLWFETGKGDIPVVKVKNTQASAMISLQGAHLLSWFPKNEDEVIWVSEGASFLPGKSVRGGIPICWPWFGPHDLNETYPAHGFARTVFWQVYDVRALTTGETLLVFELDTAQLEQSLQTMWPQPTYAEYRITVGRILKLELTTTNDSNSEIIVGQALHTYFQVEDVRRTRVLGLEDKDYLDKTDEFKRKSQSGPVTITKETDRVFLDTADDLVIDNGVRQIFIQKQGSHSTVVWNPWKDVATKMGDLGPDGYLKMLCVESANAADDVIALQPGESHTLRVSYEVNK